MQRLGCSIACWIVAIDCIEKALGVRGQELFPENWVLLWIAPAIWWLVFGVKNLRAAQ